MHHSPCSEILAYPAGLGTSRSIDRFERVPMMPSSRFQWHRFSLLALLMILGLAGASAFGDDTMAEADQAPLQLGRVTILGPATCPAGATQGAACTNVSVSCPRVPDLT